MTNGEIEAFLWEELHSPQYLQTLFYSLRKTLRGIGFEDLLIRTRNHTSIDVSKLHCDLYEFLKGSADAVNSYAGEYMNNYSWAELTNARLYNGTFSDFVLAAQARSRR
jgi:two-component system LytT family response regulator